MFVKKAAVSFLVFLTAAAIGFAFLLFFAGIKEAHTPAQSGGYLLKACGESLGVYREGEETPFETVEIPLSLLPAFDQAALTEGVYAADEAALKKLLEDYSS